MWIISKSIADTQFLSNNSFIYFWENFHLMKFQTHRWLLTYSKGVNVNYLLIVMQIANFSQITHSPTFGRAFIHENDKLWISRKSYFFSFNARREIHTAAVVLSKIFVSPKMVAMLNFQSFYKTQKCLYLENHTRWSELNKIFDLLGISAE